MNINLNDLINDIEKQDISAFSEIYIENICIDFKQFWDKVSSEEKEKKKRDFVVDVTSFANTSGGYLIFGIKEKDKIPVEFTPFEIPSIEDLEKQLGQLIQTRVEPPLVGYKFKAIEIAKSKYIFIVMIPKSFNAPHGVKKPDDVNYYFYGRTNDGRNYPYKFSEIKEHFIGRDNTQRKIKLFRDHRIHQILSGDAPIPIGSDGKILMHILPLESFEKYQQYDIEKFYYTFDDLLPIHGATKGHNRRRNFDGILVHDNSPKYGQYSGYVQLYRNGILESVDSSILKKYQDDNQNLVASIPGQAYENHLISALERYLQALIKIGISGPIYCAITLLNVKEYIIQSQNMIIGGQERGFPIDRDMVILPEFEIFDLTKWDCAKDLLRPSFDLIWNACGLHASPNYEATEA